MKKTGVLRNSNVGKTDHDKTGLPNIGQEREKERERKIVLSGLDERNLATRTSLRGVNSEL
jgi:hypothetical protein